MHLCTNCQTIDWDARIRTDRQRATSSGTLKAYCPHCTQIGGGRTVLPYASHVACERCAALRNECQACGASTLSTLEQASQEAFETLFDAYVTLVKTYGATIARKLLSDANLDAREAPHAATLIVLDVGLVDSAQAHQPYHYRLMRPIWTTVWGPLGFNSRPPRCENCPPPPRSAPVMVRAGDCGHWTAGHIAAWCLPCAVARRVCACCETSTE